MRDIPMFVTENGAASLILREIPYSGRAYIRVHDSRTPARLLEECTAFCRAAGASECFACGGGAEAYPLFTRICKMQGKVSEIGERQATVFPVTEETLPCFLEIYNEKMQGVPAAAYLSASEGKKHLTDGYFVHRGGTLLGIGIVEGNKLSAIAACQKGAGREVLAALCRAAASETVFLEVAENNLPAVRLYEKCGFVKMGISNIWNKIF